MRGEASVWRRVRRLEGQRPAAAWTGPLPVVCPQRWPAADAAAWEEAWAARDGETMDVLIERNTGMPPLPVEAGIGCIVVHHLPPRETPCTG